VRNNLAKLFGEVFDKGTNMFPVSETDIGKWSCKTIKSTRWPSLKSTYYQSNSNSFAILIMKAF
jgi:hypothetical protein